MDLSGNICGFCCTVFPRAVLSTIQAEEEELVEVLVGREEKKDLVICPSCGDQLAAFTQFLKVARSNIAKLRLIQQEQQELRQKERRDSPDTTWTRGHQEDDPVSVSPQLEISVRASPSPPVQWSRDNTVTITALDSGDCLAKEAAAREANRIRNVRYRERKRAREAQLRGFISCHSLAKQEQVERIDVTPDLSITMEEQEEEGDHADDEVVKQRRDEAVSPPPCDLAPILVPTSTAGGGIPPSFRPPPPSSTDPSLDPEERRRKRNREASRRYRERARGDPELLRRMREQQNRRQKKYYARLKERKHGDIGTEDEAFGDDGYSDQKFGSIFTTDCV